MDKLGWYLTTKEYRKDGVTLITPTGDRQSIFRRCSYYIDRQDFKKPIQWIIVDDGKVETTPPAMPNKPNLELNYIRQSYNGNTKHSFLSNLKRSLKCIQFHKVIIIEDDDWYSSQYLTITDSRLNNYQMVGETPNRYYNIPENYYAEYHTEKHSSLCNTAFQSAKVLPFFRWAIDKKEVFVDCKLWSIKKIKKFLFHTDGIDKSNCIGLKGLPGRSGIGSGHRPHLNGKLRRGYKKDHNWEKLTEWIGKKDVEWYKGFTK